MDFGIEEIPYTSARNAMRLLRYNSISVGEITSMIREVRTRDPGVNEFGDRGELDKDDIGYDDIL
jgi:hypothetical protein